MERTAVWKTVPPPERSIRVNPINPCSKKTRRRWNEHGLYGYNGFYQRCYLILDLLRIAFAPIRRGMPPARDNPWQSQRPTGANKSNNTKKSVKEQIRRIGFIRDCLWTWRASQRRASTSMGYCLPDSITSISFSNPETSSRVTLATLGIVFQTKLVVAHQVKA